MHTRSPHQRLLVVSPFWSPFACNPWCSSDESEDFIGQQSMPKKVKSEEVFATPVMTPHAVTTPASAVMNTTAKSATASSLQHQHQQHHHQHLSYMGPQSPPSSSSSTASTPAPSNQVFTPVSLVASTSHLSPSSVSSSSSSSSIEEDVAYLKSMNNVLLTELTQMKRRTQTQEETISWLIQELARTQRHVEVMSQHHIAEKMIKTEATSPAAVNSRMHSPSSNGSTSTTLVTSGSSSPYHHHHQQQQHHQHHSGGLPTPNNNPIINLSSGSLGSSMNGGMILNNSNSSIQHLQIQSASSNNININNTAAAAAAAMIFSPHSNSSSSTYGYDTTNLSSSAGLPNDFVDYPADELSLYPTESSLM